MMLIRAVLLIVFLAITTAFSADTSEAGHEEPGMVLENSSLSMLTSCLPFTTHHRILPSANRVKALADLYR